MSIKAEGVAPRLSAVYEYGFRPHHVLVKDERVLDWRSVVEHQARQTHETYNRGVEICRRVFGEIMDFLREFDPEIAALEQRIAGYNEQWKAAKKNDDRDTLRSIAAARSALRQEWFKRIWAARDVRENKERVRVLLADVGTTRKDHATGKERALYRRVYTERGDLYWGTASVVMTRLEQAFQRQLKRCRPVDFQKWSERTQDVLTHQITSGGLPVSDLLAGGKPWLSLGRPTGNGGRCYRPLALRIAPGIEIAGSVQWHRDPPTGSIKYARLVRKRLGRKWKYYVQLVVATNEPIRTLTPIASGTAAIDYGWAEEGESRRLAGFADDAHPEGEHIVLDAGVVDLLDRSRRRQERRSRQRDALVERLKDWWADVSREAAPEAVVELMTYVGRHRLQDVAERRLAGYAKRWSEEGASWQSEMMAELKAWAARDALDHDACASLRRRALNRRDKQYQALARKIAARNRVVLVDKPDLKKSAIVKSETTGAHNPLGGKARSGRFDAGLSRLDHWLKTKLAERDGGVVKISGRTTFTCSACGARIRKADQPGDAGRMLFCGACGVVIDRDINAALNLRAHADAHSDAIAQAISGALGKEIAKRDRSAKKKAARSAGRSAAAKRERSCASDKHDSARIEESHDSAVTYGQADQPALAADTASPAHVAEQSQ